MPAKNPSQTSDPGRVPDTDTPLPAALASVPEDAARDLRRGTIAAVIAAEAMSSVRLYELGRRIGLQPGLAWLLPAALDIYALTMLRFSSRVPDGHPLRQKAAREATLALVLTVGCNALFETIVAFAAQLPSWAPGALFVVVCALAPFVAGRMIHFQAAAAARTAADTATGHPAADNPAATRPDIQPDKAAVTRPDRQPVTRPDSEAVTTTGQPDTAAPAGQRPHSGGPVRTPEPDTSAELRRSEPDSPAGQPPVSGDPVRTAGPLPGAPKRRATDAELMSACQLYAVETGTPAADLTRAQIKEAADVAGYTVSNDRVTKIALSLDSVSA